METHYFTTAIWIYLMAVFIMLCINFNGWITGVTIFNFPEDKDYVIERLKEAFLWPLYLLMLLVIGLTIMISNIIFSIQQIKEKWFNRK